MARLVESMISSNAQSSYGGTSGRNFSFISPTSTKYTNLSFLEFIGVFRIVRQILCYYTAHVLGYVCFEVVRENFMGAQITVTPKWEWANTGNLCLPQMTTKGTAHCSVTFHLAGSYTSWIVIFMVLPFFPFLSLQTFSVSSISFSVCCLSCPSKSVNFL